MLRNGLFLLFILFGLIVASTVSVISAVFVNLFGIPKAAKDMNLELDFIEETIN